MLEGQIITLLVLLVLSGFFSGIETALMSVNAIKVRSLLRQKRKGSEALARIKKDPHKLIITILIGNNLVNIGAASLATVVFTNLFGSSGIGIATGVMTFLILIFGEITPKTLATQNAEKISLVVARPIEMLSWLLTPFVKIFGAISGLISKIFGSGDGEGLSPEELKVIVTMGKDEGILSGEAAEMMQNILEFDGTRVDEVMTPKFECEMLDGNKKLKNVIDFVIKSPYSRYPVYIKDKDNVIGILDVDDVLKYAKNSKLGVQVKSIIRKADFVPEAKEIDDLLVEFEKKKRNMAIVVDEYGNFSGVVTVEDILEEIVGDIFDKSKKDSKYVAGKDKVVKIDAKIPINELNSMFKLDIDKKQFKTLAGFIESKLKKIPKKGERVVLSSGTIEVDKVTKNKIVSVKLIRK